MKISNYAFYLSRIIFTIRISWWINDSFSFSPSIIFYRKLKFQQILIRIHFFVFFTCILFIVSKLNKFPSFKIFKYFTLFLITLTKKKNHRFDSMKRALSLNNNNFDSYHILISTVWFLSHFINSTSNVSSSIL